MPRQDADPNNEMTQALFDAAWAAREHAYAPYSGYKVGAAVRTRGGQVFSGCNVENAAYPQGVCAEASALSAMVLAGEREVVEVAVVGGDDPLCTPCGGCRQRLSEFANEAVPVHLCSSAGVQATMTLGELMPHAFGPRQLA